MCIVAEKAMFTDFNSLNKEAFMIIVGHIWNKWPKKQFIVKATKRAGITSLSLMSMICNMTNLYKQLHVNKLHVNKLHVNKLHVNKLHVNNT